MQFPNHRRFNTVWPARVSGALALAAALLSGPLHAQSEASFMLSALPVASVAVVGVGASMAAGAALAAPAALSVAGSVLVVKTIESTARGTVLVLERASDATRFTVDLAGAAASGASLVAGTVVTVGVVGSGVVLSAAGQAIAFVPNQLGRALLHNERLTF